MKVLLSIIVLCMASHSFAQSQNAEKEAIKNVITTMFDGMRKSDTTLLKSALAEGMVLQSINDKAGSSALVTEPIKNFIQAIAKPHQQMYDERVVFSDIKIDGNLASVWAPYKFYFGTQFSHCGVDVFQLIKSAGVWKIIYIVDTRRTDNCPE